MDGSCSLRFISPCPTSPAAPVSLGRKDRNRPPHSTARANHRATDFPARHGGVFRMMIRCSCPRPHRRFLICVISWPFVVAPAERIGTAWRYLPRNSPRRAAAATSETPHPCRSAHIRGCPPRSDAGAHSFVSLGVPSWFPGLDRFFRAFSGRPGSVSRLSRVAWSSAPAPPDQDFGSKM